jgi:hypothetical protein
MAVPGSIAQFGDVVRAREQLGLGPFATMNPLPWASVSDSTSQTLGANDYTPQQITFDTIEGQSDQYFASNAFTAKYPGTYLITFSAIINLSSGANKNHHIWLRKNNTDVPRSDTHTIVANTNEDHATTVNFLLALNAFDVITLWQSGDSTSLKLASSAAVAGPKGYPASPSIIATFNLVSP